MDQVQPPHPQQPTKKPKPIWLWVLIFGAAGIAALFMLMCGIGVISGLETKRSSDERSQEKAALEAERRALRTKKEAAE